MGFLSPALLFLGAAATVPLILHLLQRHQGPRVVFPALRYLRRAEKESARRIRLRQLLLMLLRIAAVLLIALAAGRPFAQSGGAGHEPTAVAIVLDNSMSTGAVVDDRRVLDELKSLALATLERAGPDDRFWLIRAGAPWEPAMPGDAAVTAARIRQTEPTWAAADLPASLTHARALLAAGAEGRAAEIHLLSDLQARSFVGAAAQDGESGPPVIAWAGRTRPPPNAAVARVDVGGGFSPTADERSSVVAGAVSTEASDSIRLRLTVDGRVVGAGMAPPGAAAVLSLPGRPVGLYAGSVETDPDALRADDRRFFTLRVVPPPTVGTVGDVPFVDDALAVMTSAGRVRRASAASADVTILEAASGLEALADDGMAIVLPPESPLELPAVNRRLGAAGVPWRYEAVADAGESRFALEADNDELLGLLERARLTQVYALRPQGAVADDSVLLRLRDDSPWAVRGTREGAGNYILLGSPLSPTATTVPTSAAMVPLLDRLVGPWAATEPARPPSEPGETVLLPDGTTEIEHPDGSTHPASPGEHRITGGAGVYRVRSDGAVLGLIAVNPPPTESDLTRIEPRRLRDLIPASDIETVSSERGWTSDIFRNRLGRELWRLVLYAVLLLLAIEAIVAASGRARREQGERDLRSEPARHVSELAS